MKDAELSAAEIVRRAERCIGLAIRKGQAEGRIVKAGDTPPAPTEPYERVRFGKRETIRVNQPHVRDANRRSPRDFVRNAEERVQTYAMADNVTPEQFDAAIAKAKAERNLSRANVVRKRRPAQWVAPGAGHRFDPPSPSAGGCSRAQAALARHGARRPAPWHQPTPGRDSTSTGVWSARNVAPLHDSGHPRG